MKKTALVILFLLSIHICFSQADSIPVKKKQAPQQDRLMVDLYHDNWLNRPDSVHTKWFSYGVAVSMLYDYPLGKSNFSFAGGADITEKIGRAHV